MRKIYDFSGAVLFFTALFTVNSCNNASDKKAAIDKVQDSLDVRITRGAYLVNTICLCMHCHADRDFTKFAGPVIKGTEGKGGEEIEKGIYVRNITPYALGSWTDDEIYRAITTGIRKNGDTLTLMMPYSDFVKMPKEEIYSIIAYLRTLKPIAHNVPERKLDSANRSFWTTLYRNLYLKSVKEKLPLPSPDDTIKMGAYLVNAGGCTGCHTKFDMNKMDYDKDYLAGGNLFIDSSQGFKVNTANLTPDIATGIGGWTQEMFLNKFKNYRDEKNYSYSPGKYNSFMPWTILANAKDEDLKAIYAYLHSIKPVSNKVEKWPD
jgi:mono/diheme cytochrome c family protein